MRAIGLVVVVLLLAILLVPLGVVIGMRMGDDPCPGCRVEGGACASGGCMLVLAVLTLMVPGVAHTHRAWSRAIRRLSLARSLERPPEAGQSL